jgi:ABC-type polysaccharide/polyol phosphate export permease
MRWSLLGTPAPTRNRIGYSIAVALILWLVGTWIFRRIEQSFADEI